MCHGCVLMSPKRYFCAIKSAVIAFGKSCLFASTKKTAFFRSSLFMSFSNSSMLSLSFPLSEESTTKITACEEGKKRKRWAERSEVSFLLSFTSLSMK